MIYYSFGKRFLDDFKLGKILGRYLGGETDEWGWGGFFSFFSQSMFRSKSESSGNLYTLQKITNKLEK